MRRKGLLQRLGSGVVGGALLVGLLVIANPLASADSISPTFALPPGVDMGQVTIATAPGGFIDVQVKGRLDALAPTDLVSGDCTVTMGQSEDSRTIELDSNGSGSTRLGPYPDGSYAIGGRCESRGMYPISDLIAIPVPNCSYCSTIATLVSLDGNPTSQTAGVMPGHGVESLSCSDGVAAAFNGVPAAAETVIALLAKAPEWLSQTGAQAVCTLIEIAGSPNPLVDNELMYSACRTLESFFDPLGLKGPIEDFFACSVVAR